MKIFRFIVISAFILFLIILSIPVVNNIASVNVINKLLTLPLPDKTELIDSISKSGKLVGSGNGMQYFGAILIKTELSKDEINSFYQSYSIKKWDFIVERQTDNDIQVIEHGKLSFKEIPEDDKHFIIYSWGTSDYFLKDFDLRGH